MNVEEKYDNIVYCGNKLLDSKIMQAKELTNKEFNDIAKHLFKYNESKVCLTILSWCMSCFIKEKLFEIRFCQPQLYINGEAGSGKTTTADSIIKNIFSLDINDELSANSTTKFVFEKYMSCSNMFPLIIDEFRPHEMTKGHRNMLISYLKSCFENSDVILGNTEKTYKKIKLSAPVLIMGDYIPTKQIIREHNIYLNFIKSNIEKNKDAKNAMCYLENNHTLLQNLGYTMLKYCMKQKLNDVETIMRSLNLKPCDSQADTKFAIIGFSYKLFYDMAEEYKVDLPFTPEQAISIITK